MRWAAVAGTIVGVIEMPLAAGFDPVAAARAEHPTLFDVGEPLSAESSVALAVATCVGCAAAAVGDMASLTWTVDSAAYVAGAWQGHAHHPVHAWFARSAAVARRTRRVAPAYTAAVRSASASIA